MTEEKEDEYEDGIEPISGYESNLQLWKLVEKTDLEATKHVKQGTREFTSINPTYQVKRATRIFGPVGIGWSYEILEERFDEGAPIIVGDNVICREILHTLLVKLTCVYQYENLVVQHYGHTPFIFNTKYGPKTDHEYAKKSLTDALTKCFSMIGFSADVYLGMFEDNEYVEQLFEEKQIRDSDDKLEKQKEIDQQYEEFKEKHFKFIETATSANELKGVFDAAKQRISRKKDNSAMRELIKLKDKRKLELEEIEKKALEKESEQEEKETKKQTKKEDEKNETV